jgi:hypothetical protein
MEQHQFSAIEAFGKILIIALCLIIKDSPTIIFKLRAGLYRNCKPMPGLTN